MPGKKDLQYVPVTTLKIHVTQIAFQIIAIGTQLMTADILWENVQPWKSGDTANLKVHLACLLGHATYDPNL